jgi:hypothetical protein
VTEIPVAKACPSWMTPEVCDELLAACEAFLKDLDGQSDFVSLETQAKVIAAVARAKGQ